MKAMACLAITAALASSAGCLGVFSPKHPVGQAPLAKRSASYRAVVTTDPLVLDDELRAQLAAAINAGGLAVTPDDFDRRFRQNGRNYGELAGVSGVDRLRYPETGHPAAAFSYVHMGIRFETAGNHGAASRAYWGALGLTARTLGSRRQREQIRWAAYAGLARLAHRKHQPEWAALLALCSELAGTYVESGQAEEQHDEFFAALEEQVRVQRRIQEARARANRGVFLQQLSAGLGAMSAGAQMAAGNTTAFAQQMGSAVVTSVQANRQSREVAAAASKAMAELSSSVGQLREVAAEDVPDIESGKDFVARQVVWYLATAANPAPYVKGPLARYTRTRPPLRRGLRAYEATLAATGAGMPATERPMVVLERFALRLLEAERHVASFERFRIVPGPRYLASVCAPGSGHDVACHLAAIDVCRAGISEGCSVLAVLYAGTPAVPESVGTGGAR